LSFFVDVVEYVFCFCFVLDSQPHLCCILQDAGRGCSARDAAPPADHHHLPVLSTATRHPVLPLPNTR
jgi:hypothetical protein